MLRDERAARAVIGVLYAPVAGLVGLLAAIHFRRLRVRCADRFPRRGPAIVACNHPSTWGDVVVLEAALGRKLHFLAHETLFRPAPREWVLRLFGSLPVAQSQDGPGREARNEATFRRCDELLARGEVIVVFAEGVCAEDRSLLPFRTGAARLALTRIVNGGRVSVVPLGIHYADRAGFRADVVVSVGRPIHVSREDAPAAEARPAWIDALTGRLQRDVARLIVVLPDPAARGLVEELAPLMPAGRGGDPGMFYRSRRLAARLDRLRGDPQRLAALERAAEAQRLRRERLGIDLRDLDSGSRAPTAVLVVLAALAAPAALLGIALNAPPAAATAACASRYPAPSRALATILAGMGSFVIWYLAVAAIPLAGLRPWWAGLALAAVVAGLGGVALAWIDAMRVLRTRVALARLARELPRGTRVDLP